LTARGVGRIAILLQSVALTAQLDRCLGECLTLGLELGRLLLQIGTLLCEILRCDLFFYFIF